MKNQPQPSSMPAISFHPLRDQLISEAFARPSLPLERHTMATRLTLSLSSKNLESGTVHNHLRLLCERLDLPVPPPAVRHHIVDAGAWKLVWELHTEFLSLTFITTGAEDLTFTRTALQAAPADWIEKAPGEILSATHLAITPSEAKETDVNRAADAFDSHDFAAIRTGRNPTTAAVNFRPDADGFVRMIIFDRGASAVFLGRLTQRLLEIDFYRLAALLALPVARTLLDELTRLESRLEDIFKAFAVDAPHAQDRQLLSQLSTVAGEIERLQHTSRYRFDAARAYHRIVIERVERLRENRIEGSQRISTFMDHRLAPAMRTCEAASARLDAMAVRVSRAADLLATKVSVAVEEQNASQLQMLNTRTKAQLRLQETVEGLSTVAITYYAVSLIQYVLKAVEDASGARVTMIGTALAIPLVAGVAFYGVRTLRKRLASDAAD